MIKEKLTRIYSKNIAFAPAEHIVPQIIKSFAQLSQGVEKAHTIE